MGTRVKAESWPQVARRLERTIDEMEEMLRHLRSRRSASIRRKRERELCTKLAWVVEWAERWIELGGPMDHEEGKELVMELYELDLERAQLVDEFQELLDEAGEALPPE